jgi:hypothetical protein
MAERAKWIWFAKKMRVAAEGLAHELREELGISPDRIAISE